MAVCPSIRDLLFCRSQGAGNGLTVRLVRHSHRKRGETDRPRLRNTVPALDPTANADSSRNSAAHLTIRILWTDAVHDMNIGRVRMSVGSKAVQLAVQSNYRYAATHPRDERVSDGVR